MKCGANSNKPITQICWEDEDEVLREKKGIGKKVGRAIALTKGKNILEKMGPQIPDVTK